MVFAHSLVDCWVPCFQQSVAYHGFVDDTDVILCDDVHVILWHVDEGNVGVLKQCLFPVKDSMADVDPTRIEFLLS